MTDITRLINDLNHRMHSAKNLGFDFLFLKLDDLDVIAGALETLQRANTAQGGHIEQLQGTIHQLDKKNSELESRSITVKLPKRSVSEVMHMSGFSLDYAEGWCAGNDNAIHEISNTAGIKWEAE